MSGCPAPKYTRAQRVAVAAAYRPWDVGAQRVAELAAAGNLLHPSGARLDPFHIPPNTVRAIARRARSKGADERADLRLAAMEPRDALEQMRVHLADVIETELERIEIEQSQDRQVSGEAIRQLARAVREYAALPAPDERRPRAPGAKLNGIREGGQTRGGLAGKIIAASARNGPW